MRARVALATFALGVLIAAVAVIPGGAAKRDTQTLKFTVRIPVGALHGGPDQGDVHAFAGELFRGSALAGSYSGSCVVTVAGPQRLQCSVTADLRRRGQIVAVGAVGPAGSGSMVVVGGTGRFEDVHGTRVGRNVRSADGAIVADLIYRLER